MRKIIGIALCLLLLAACSTTKVGLKYESAAAPARTPPAADAKTVRIADFVDKRPEPANWIGAIRGTYGNPIKNLETDQPVVTIVQQDFVDALKARGVTISATAPTQLTGIVRQLNCNQVFRREANVEIEMFVVDTATGQSTFQQTYSTSNIDGSVIALDIGIFGSVEVLRALTEKTLRETIDKALDDPALRAALKI